LDILNDLLYGLAEILQSRAFLIAYCVFIVLYWGYWLYRLLNCANHLGEELSRAKATIEEAKDEEEFSTKYSELRDKLQQIPIIKHAWSEFDESLIKPTSDSGNRKIKNTLPASAFFSDESIIKPQLDVRFYVAIPNHLTGFGILGTFLGLAGGIGLAARAIEQATDDPTLMTQALGQLLGGASLAFITSIFGLVTSFLFLFIERLSISRLHSTMNAFRQELDGRLSLVTAEHIQQESLLQLRKQTAAMEFFGTDVAMKLGEKINETVETRLSPLIQSLNEEVKALKEEQSKTGQKLVQTMSGGLGEVVEIAAGNEMKNLARVLQELQTGLQTSQQSMKSNQDEIAESLRRISSSIESSLTASTNEAEARMKMLLENVVAGVGATVGKMSEALEKAGEGAAATVNGSASAADSAMKKIAEAANALNEQVQSAKAQAQELEELRGALAETRNGFSSLIGPLKSSAESFQNSGGKTQEAAQMLQQLTSQIEATASSLKEKQDSVMRVWGEYQQRFEGIDKSLVNVFQEIDAGLAKYAGGMRDYAKGIDEQTAKALKSLSAAVAGLNDSIESLEEQIERLAKN